MKPSIVLVAFLFALVGSRSVASAQGAQTLFFFDFSSDQTGAFELEGPATSSMTWDPASGSPAPGSLRLESPVGQPATITRAIAPCVPWDQASPTQHRLTVNSLEAGSSNCELWAEAFSLPDCSGGPSVGPVSTVDSDDEWVEAIHEVGAASQQFYESLRFSLVLSGVGSCNFDNVRLVSLSLDPIPALDVPGLVAFIGRPARRLGSGARTSRAVRPSERCQANVERPVRSRSERLERGSWE